MKKWTAFLALAFACGLGAPQSGEALKIGVAPRLALPTGDFADVAGLGFGLGATYSKEVKGFPGMVNVGLLKFGEKEIGPVKSNTRMIYVTVGPRYNFTEAAGGKIYGKVEIGRYFVNTEAKAGGRKATASGGETKIVPGIGLNRGNLGVEIDYALSDWIGVNLSFTFGGED